MSGVFTSPPFRFSPLQSKSSSYSYRISVVNPSLSSLSSINLKKQPCLRFGTPTRESNLASLECNSSTGPGGPASGDNESKNVLDAFFLGKALAEAVNERVESAVGEFLSTIGRLQAEQQKQIQDFQEDVLERAKRAKENAALEAMEAQGLIPKPTVDTYGVNTAATSSQTSNNITPPNSSDVSAAQTGIDQGFGVTDDE